MPSHYQKGSLNVPETLVKPTSSFKRHVILAIIGLALFVGIYGLLMFWFGSLSYNLFAATFTGTGNGFVTFIMGVGLAFLSLFMLKSLFIFKKREDILGKELTIEKEPVLFEYLYQLADEAGAPRPHKVYVTSRVNASVFYDLSILNLLFPSKKNLEIGLGLINVLNKGELKAVLAHEFGHFAQRSMLLGRYVYTAQQIAVRVVNKRDALDSFLVGLSHVDLRIAWIGWILSILVWAVRSLIQTLFSVVAIAEKALSREMEFQADLVAVSLTGSDALIHALYKLKIADEAYNSALEAVNQQLQEKKAVQDMFSLQTNYIEKMRWVQGDPKFGLSPERIEKDSAVRIFSKASVNPPEMWSTHPSDNDREDNAKSVYIYADIDGKPAWDLIADPKALRKEVTAELIKTAEVETVIIGDEDSIKKMNEEDFSWSFLNPKYRGAFVARFPFVNYDSIEDIYDIQIGENLKDVYSKLYPENLSEIIEEHKSVKDEIQALENTKHEVLTAEKRVIVHRGNRVKRRQIPEIIEGLKKEEVQLRNILIEHDRSCRKVNYNAAKALNQLVAEHLKSMSSLVHYAEHCIVDLKDMTNKHHNTLHVVLADGKVSSQEMIDLISVSNQLHKIIKSVFDNSKLIKLDSELVKKLGGKPYQDLFEEFKLGLAGSDNINEWLNAVGSWAEQAEKGLTKLRNAALGRLLNIEEEVKKAHLEGKPLDVTIEKISVVEKYKTLMPGNERKLQLKLGMWDRFHMGDGLIPALAKFSVSGAMIFAALYFGSISQELTLHLYNGLSISVYTNVNGETYSLFPNSTNEINIDYNENFLITTTDLNGDTIESFEEVMHSRSSNYVYNVANSGYFTEYTVSYGYEVTEEERLIGSPRWFHSGADYILEEAPNSISSSSHSTGGTRDVLAAYSNIHPYTLPNIDDDSKEVKEMIMNHAKWDDDENKYFLYWFSLAAGKDSTLNFLNIRLKHDPNEVISQRMIQDNLNGIAHDDNCKNYKQLSKENPDNGDYYYLSTRCMDDGAEQDSLFVKGHRKFPNNSWLAFASGFVYGADEEWVKANECYKVALTENPFMINFIGSDFERIERLLVSNDQFDKESEMLLIKNDWVSYYRNLEKGDEASLENNFDKAYYLLSQGDIKASINYAATYEEEFEQFNWYIAGSKNATESTLNEVFSYDAETGITVDNIWIALAVRAKHNKDNEPFIAKFNEFIDNETLNHSIMPKFLKFILLKDIKKAEELLKEISNVKLKTLHRMMGVIILGEKAPQKWKEHTDRLLFITEKPYLPSTM